MQTKAPALANDHADPAATRADAAHADAHHGSLADHRSGASAQRILQASIGASARVQGQGMQRAAIDASPRMAAQRRVAAAAFGDAVAPESTPAAVNKTGLPDQLKSGVESLSGMRMDHVKVHYNSARPAQLNALAYAQGTDIHIAPGQERHLPHEAWHVVQQAQGRVNPTRQAKGVKVNDDLALEREADVMGQKAMRTTDRAPIASAYQIQSGSDGALQRRVGIEYETGIAARITNEMSDKNEYAGFVPQDEEMMVSGQGWKIVSDNSKLEFVTDPPVAPAALPDIVTNMLGAINAMPVPLNANMAFNQVFPQAAALKNYTILPYAQRMLTGVPQGTIGIPFAKLYDLFALLTRYDLNASKVLAKQHGEALKQKWLLWKAMPANDPQKTPKKVELETFGAKLKDERKAGTTAISGSKIAQFGKIKLAVDLIVDALAVQIPNVMHRTELKGLLHFVGQYMLAANSHEKGYKKMAFSLMARTSFSRMYGALDNTAKGEFVVAANALRTQLGIAVDAIAFPGQTGAFKITDWINSIETPVNVAIPDDTQPLGYRNENSDLMTAPGTFGKGANPTDASMGAMGLDNGLVVLELRTLHHFTEFGGFTPLAMAQLAADLGALTQA